MATNPSPEDTKSFHRKYRPQTLDKIIGHSAAVTRLKGMLAKPPAALLFVGPSSVGKTTLARALAVEVNGKPVEQQTDYKELNAADQRGIDDMRELIRISRFKPQSKQRFIVIDEAQQLLSNKAAAMSLLKPIEEPAPNTTWVICTMDPSKFQVGDGKAISNRCKQIVLEPHTNSDLLKQAVRIAKGERMSYVMDEDKSVLKQVVRASNGEMRTLANVMENLCDFYNGLDEKPDQLTKAHVTEVLTSSESSDDRLAVELMIGLYARKYAIVQRALIDVADGFQFIRKVVWISQFMLNVAVLEGAKHPKVWWAPSNREVHTKTKALNLTLGTLASVNARLIKVQAQAASFQIPPQDLLSSELYYLIKEMAA